MDILIFKTDIANRFHYGLAGRIIEKIPGVLKWSVDMDDIDRVLRVVAQNLKPVHIEQPLVKAGYFCRELED